MSILAGDPLTRLAFSIAENKGVYALLLGSGLSRAAEIPTGWEITLDLVRRVALAQEEPEAEDWAKWYVEKTGKQPDYSELLADIAATPAERRSILHSYIEPSAEEQEQGKKQPTKAHRAIADLVKDGFVKVIVTTNFDHLLERALRDAGVEPTVIGSPDTLSGAEPLPHANCFILKVHGDYMDTRILNTLDELENYPPAYDTLLDRIFDEYGLIVAGWSGEWDTALRAAILRCPNRRYAMYWAVRGELNGKGLKLAQHRKASIISISSADAFFSDLALKVAAIDGSKSQSPATIQMLVATTKRLIAKPEYRIQLSDLIATEVTRLKARMSEHGLDNQGEWSNEEFIRRVNLYQSLTEPLAAVWWVIGQWGDESQTQILWEILQDHYEAVGRNKSGIQIYVELQCYPAVLLLAAYGLALLKTDRLSELHRLLDYRFSRNYQGPVRIVEKFFLWGWQGGTDDVWRRYPGLERHRSPLSDHMLTTLTEWEYLSFSQTPRSTVLFEKFEMLASLVFFEGYAPDKVVESFKGEGNYEFMPVGRMGWDSNVRNELLAEIDHPETRKKLFSANFAHRRDDIIDVYKKNLLQICRQHYRF